jgi:hypothetical protein
LPRLDVAKELARMERIAREQEIAAFVYGSPLRARAHAKFLDFIRRRRGEPDWVPSGILSGCGWPFSLGVDKIMRRLWEHGFRLPEKSN